MIDQVSVVEADTPRWTTLSPFQRELAALGACYTAVLWVGDRDLATAWAACTRPDWMLWLAEVKRWRGRHKAARECVRVAIAAVSGAELRATLTAALDDRAYVTGVKPCSFVEAYAINAVNAAHLEATVDASAVYARYATLADEHLADVVRAHVEVRR